MTHWIMKKIPFQPKSNSLTIRETVITFGKVRPFVNICEVTGVVEHMNAEIRYIPDESVIEIGSYRKRLDKGFSNYVEDVAHIIYDEIETLISPKSLSVKVYLDDEYLSPWSVEVSS